MAQGALAALALLLTLAAPAAQAGVAASSRGLMPACE